MPSPRLLEITGLLADSFCLTSYDLRTLEDMWGPISDSLSAKQKVEVQRPVVCGDHNSKGRKGSTGSPVSPGVRC